MTMLQPMPVISRSKPAYTNDDYTGIFPASNADDFTYSGSTGFWQCATTPVGGANSGTLTQAVYLAYDLSSIPSSQRQNVVLIWYNDPLTGSYNPTLIGGGYQNCPSNYTIDTNVAAGGSLPGSGWVTQATVTNNPYHSRQHAFNMNGANWVRINVTAITGQPAANNCALNMDVHDAHNGNNGVIVYGDSISSRGFDHSDNTIGLILPAQINAARVTYWPLWENASTPGYTANDLVAVVSNTWLPLFSGKYVVLAIGTNDANGAGFPLNNYSANMQTMINAIAAAGKIAIIPHIPWARAAGVQTNGPTINANIDALIAANPTTTMAGPDLWAYFNANQSLISGDNLHPTDPAGYTAYRTQWLNWATTNIYFNTLNTSVRTAYKVRTVLNTLAQTAYKVRTVLKTLTHTSFKIQLSGAGPKPYSILGVATNINPLRPYSTVSSSTIVVDQNNALQNSLTASVTVTFPDSSTTTPQVYWLGNGQYSTTYTTKGPGTVAELWVFTGSSGGQAQYKNEIVCHF